ncbi:hypothetical protein Tco_0482185, partial [Tanacetum coccineum]
PTSVVRSSGELSASVEREFVRDASVGDGGDQGFDSVGGQDNVEPIVPITEHVETETPRPKRTKKKRVIRGSERTPAASHPPKRLRTDYGTTDGFATGGKSPSVLNRLLQDSRLMVEQGVPAFPTLPFITSSVTASHLEEGRDHTDSVTGPSLRTVGPSTRFVVLSDSSHHSGTKSADPEVDSLVRSAVPVMTEAITVTTIATTVAIPTDVGKDKSAPHPSVFGSSSSSEKTDRTLSLFTGRSGSGFAAGSIRAEEAIGAGLEEIYVPEWTVTKGFELNDGHSCANMIDHFTPPAFFKNGFPSLTVHELETSSTDLREKLEMYEGILKQIEEFQDNLMRPLETRLAEINADFTRCCMRFQESFHPHLLNVVAGRRWLLTHGMKLLMAKCLNSTEYMEALGHAFGRAIEKGMQEGLAAGIEHGQAGRCLTDLEAYIPSAEVDFNSAIRDLRDLDFLFLQELSNKKDASTWDVMDLLRLDDIFDLYTLEATEGSLRGEVASAKEHNGLLEQECGSLKLKVTSLESIIAEKDRELSDLGASSSSLRSQNQSLVNQVHELETSSTDLREKLEMYEGILKQIEEFQDNLMRPLETRLAEIDADFTRCCMRFQESFHPHLLNVVAGRRWLLTHGMKLLMAKCLNSTEYMEALGNAFGRAIEKGMQEAYIPSAEDDYNSAVCDLRGLNFPLLQELSNKKDASTWDAMDLLRLDDAVAEALGMTNLQPDMNQLMVPVHHKQDMVVIRSQALSVALDICRGRVEKMERNLVERLPFLKDVFISLDHPLSAEALIEPPVEVPATNVLSTVVIVPHSGPSVSVEDYENPDLVDVVPKNVTPGPEGEENIDASTGGDLAFSKLDDEARDAIL